MKIRSIFHLIKEMGIPWLWYRGLYLLYQKTSIQKAKFKYNKIDWAIYSTLSKDIEKEELEKCFSKFDILSKIPAPIQQFYQNNQNVSDEIHIGFTKIKNGIFTYFSKSEYQTNQPPDWFFNPQNNTHVDQTRHWTDISDFSSVAGDIKWIWELSRFSFVYDLVRYYILTKDETAIDIFWQLINDWIDKNGPELGPHWKCGQEIAIRSIAWIFGLQYFYKSSHSSVENILRMIGFLRYNALHIEKNFWYAEKCVRNNHTISEAAGMFIIGLTLPFIPESQRLVKKGKVNLEEEVSRQIYNDGSYLQHSHNYHRLVVQTCSVCVLFAKLSNIEFSQTVFGKIQKSVSFLYNNQDESTGMLPNYGNNDGALLQKLSSCDYSDFRPQLQVMYFQITGKRLYNNGIWDENVLWYDFENRFITSGRENLIRKSEIYPIGGYYILRDRGNNCFGAIRCAKYKDRPAQADMLHFDFWYKGKNILCDPGTYSYNTDEDHSRFYFSTKHHNTVTIDAKDQMRKISKFLWINWPICEVIKTKFEKEMNTFIGKCTSYDGRTHLRMINHVDNLWWIQDIISNYHKSAEINWNISGHTNIIDDYCAIIDALNETVTIKTDYKINRKKGYLSRYYGVENEMTQISGQCSQSIGDEIIFNTVFYIGKNILEHNISEVINKFGL